MPEQNAGMNNRPEDRAPPEADNSQQKGRHDGICIEPRCSFAFRKSTVSVLTATTSIHATGAGITAATDTRLALQLILKAEFS